MFQIIFGLLGSFISVIGSIMICIVLILLFGSELAVILMCFLLTPLIVVPLFAGISLDRKLRKNFGLLYKPMFSPLWTTVSIIELSLLAVFLIITIIGLIPISVLICDVIIYIVLSVLILGHKIKKLSNTSL